VHDSVGPKASSTVTTITDVDADLEATGGALRVPRFTGALGQTRLTGVAEAGPTGAALRMSTESVRNADLPALFALAGLEPYPGLSIDGKAPFEMSASLPADFAGFVVTGKAAVDRVRLGTMSLEQMQAPFRFERGRFTLDPLGFTMYGGRQQGSVAIDLTRSVPVYTIKSAITGLDVNRALSATTTMKDFLTGSARMTANLTGSGSTAPAIQRSLTGNVKFELRDGVLRNFPLAAAINQALGITEGNSRDTKFELMSASAVVGGGRARSDDLLLRAGDLGITGKGVLGFDRTLDFQLRAALSAARSGQLAQKVALLQHLTDDQGQISMPVSVSGTATNPKTSVDVGTVAKKQVKEQVQKGLLKLLEKH